MAPLCGLTAASSVRLSKSAGDVSRNPDPATTSPGGLGRYFSNLAYNLRCLNGLGSLSRAVRQTAFPRS